MSNPAPAAHTRGDVQPPCACELHLLSSMAFLRRSIAEGVALGCGSEFLNKLRELDRQAVCALADLS